MLALGLIEVIGLPPAIEAADAALKAANVTLIAVAKADAGILTIEITGDVGAVTAAVDAGAAAASRIGTLRAKHIIPRVDESLIGKVIKEGTKLFQPKGKATKQFLKVKEEDVPIEAFVSHSIKSEDIKLDKLDNNNLSKLVENNLVGTPTSEIKIDETKIGEAQTGKIRTDITQADETQADETQADETQSDETQADETQADETQSDETQTDKKQTDETQTDEIKLQEIYTDENKTGENKTGDNPNIDNPIQDSITQGYPKSDTLEYTASELKRLNNDALRDILQKKGVKLTEKHVNAKKQELIQQILTMQNDR